MSELRAICWWRRRKGRGCYYIRVCCEAETLLCASSLLMACFALSSIRLCNSIVLIAQVQGRVAIGRRIKYSAKLGTHGLGGRFGELETI